MWVEFFVFGTIWFWLLLGAVTIVLFALIENDRFGWATFSLLLAAAVLHLFGDVNVFAFAREQPLTALLLAGGYAAAGTFWGLGKWFFFVQRERRRYEHQKAEFLRSKGVSGNVVPPELKQAWRKECGGVTYQTVSDDPDRCRKGVYPVNMAPKASDHRGQIIGWMIYWPWSLVWTLINDPVVRLFKWIYRQIQGLLQKISDHAFRGTKNDFE